MSGPTVKFETRGVAKAVLDVGGPGLRARDIRPAAPEVRRRFAKIESRRFESSGPGWAPLAEMTVAKKEKLGQNRGILRATNALYQALTSASPRDARDSHDRIALGAGVPSYGRFAQRGTATEPKRLLIDLSPSDEKQLAQPVRDYVVKGSRR